MITKLAVHVTFFRVATLHLLYGRDQDPAYKHGLSGMTTPEHSFADELMRDASAVAGTRRACPRSARRAGR
jgi:hypothetical protein